MHLHTSHALVLKFPLYPATRASRPRAIVSYAIAHGPAQCRQKPAAGGAPVPSPLPAVVAVCRMRVHGRAGRGPRQSARTNRPRSRGVVNRDRACRPARDLPLQFCCCCLLLKQPGGTACIWAEAEAVHVLMCTCTCARWSVCVSVSDACAVNRGTTSYRWSAGRVHVCWSPDGASWCVIVTGRAAIMSKPSWRRPGVLASSIASSLRLTGSAAVLCACARDSSLPNNEMRDARLLIWAPRCQAT